MSSSEVGIPYGSAQMRSTCARPDSPTPLDWFSSIRTVMLDASGKSGYQRSSVSSRPTSNPASPITCIMTVLTMVLVMLPIFCWLSGPIGSPVPTSASPRTDTHSPSPGIHTPMMTPGTPDAANPSSSAVSSSATSSGSSEPASADSQASAADDGGGAASDTEPCDPDQVVTARTTTATTATT